MRFRPVLDRTSPVPPWQQLHDQLLAQVDDATLAPGDRLPTVRTLADDPGVAAGTVARAYRALEAQGAVVTARRAGTVVRDRSAPTDDAEVREAASALARAGVAGGPGRASRQTHTLRKHGLDLTTPAAPAPGAAGGG